MQGFVLLIGLCSLKLSVAQVGFAGAGVGAYGPGLMPYPNLIPPLMIPPLPMPQIPLPYVPIVPHNVPIGATGGTVISRSNFGTDGGTTTFITSDPYGGYKYTSSSTQSHPSHGQSVINSRFNDDDGSASHSVHSSHTSIQTPHGGSSHVVYDSQTGTGYQVEVRPISVNNRGSSNVDFNPISSSNDGSSDTVVNPSYTGSDAGSVVDRRPIEGTYGGGGVAQTNYAPAYPSNYGTSSFISSTNVNGQQETVSSTNNNGYVQTYRQTNGK